MMQKYKHQSKPSGVSKISDISGITATPVKGIKPSTYSIKPSNIPSLDVNVDATMDASAYGDQTYGDQTVETSYDIRPV